MNIFSFNYWLLFFRGWTISRDGLSMVFDGNASPQDLRLLICSFEIIQDGYRNNIWNVELRNVSQGNIQCLRKWKSCWNARPTNWKDVKTQFWVNVSTYQIVLLMEVNLNFCCLTVSCVHSWGHHKVSVCNVSLRELRELSHKQGEGGLPF